MSERRATSTRNARATSSESAIRVVNTHRDLKHCLRDPEKIPGGILGTDRPGCARGHRATALKNHVFAAGAQRDDNCLMVKTPIIRLYCFTSTGSHVTHKQFGPRKRSIVTS